MSQIMPPLHRRRPPQDPPPDPPSRRQRMRRGPPAPGRAVTLAQRVVFSQNAPAPGLSLMGGIVNVMPLDWARAPSGEIFFANGLMPMSKWNGVRFTARTVGVVAPTTAPTLAGSGTGDSTGAYTCYVRFIDDDGNPSNLSPVSAEIDVVGVNTFTYSNLAVPTQAKVTRKQILRNTAGQNLTYYVDIDTTDVAATTLTSTIQDDTLLAQQEAVPLFDSQGNSLANRFGVPPSHKAFLASYNDRMFAAGETPYTEGNVQVTTGSAVVQGVGTDFTKALEGRLLYVTGSGQAYPIQEVNRGNQTLTLSTAYGQVTDLFAGYAIRASTGDRRTVQFTEPGQYDAWPAVNGISIEDTGDEITGLMAAEGFLYVLQRRHIFRVTYGVDPLQDGGVFLVARRGCVNQRSWIHIDGEVFLLDERGVYRLGATRSQDAQDISGPIMDLFWLQHEESEFRINWSARRFFWAQHAPAEGVLRWFVALSGSRLPRHALCYHYTLKSWWIEEYPYPLGAGCLSEGGIARILAAGPSRKVLVHGTGHLDGPDPQAGVTRAQAASGSVVSLEEPAGVYAEQGLVGSPVTIVSGRGKAQTNRLVSLDEGVLSFQWPWRIRPDATSVFQIGGSTWRWRSGFHRWLNEEGNQERRIELVFQPTRLDASLDIRLYRDLDTPEDYGYTRPMTPAESDGVQITSGDPDAVIDLTNPVGFAQVRRSGRRERYVQRADYVQLELRGTQGRDALVIYEVNLEGAEP